MDDQHLPLEVRYARRTDLAKWWNLECALRHAKAFHFRVILDHEAELYPWAKYTKPSRAFPSALNFLSFN